MKMFKRILFLSLSLTTLGLSGYWQQDVAYQMNVHLDEKDKVITATSALTYINHSPDTLPEIFMHLYPNAFNPGTILDQEARRRGWGSVDPEKAWTGIKIKQVNRSEIATTALNFSIFDDTLLRIILDQPLNPSDTLRFNLDWTFDIHSHFDRSGWEDGQFDMTQWYPKFVVYDKNGWHKDPFGDWGEFYGEFGTFAVTLDVPEDYIIGATGVVTDGDPGWVNVWVDTTLAWEEWNQSNAATYQSYRNNLKEGTRKSVKFLAENVHDFAWVASPDLVYEHGRWQQKDVHVLFNRSEGPKWSRKESHYGERALAWLSTQFGPYPWPQMTIVKSMGGGGMEYPMLIMDGYDSEGLVVHEIGHDWFYGIFGNDELDEAWLDEGFTTFQTRWYQENRYPNREDRMEDERFNEFERQALPWLSRTDQDKNDVLSYIMSPENEPIAIHSQDFIHERSYRQNVYNKASLVLQVLQRYLGEKRFLAGMHLYYKRFALKHPTANDFIKAMEDGTGEDLDWFFDQWLHNTGWVDYALAGYEIQSIGDEKYLTTVRVKRKGEFFMPVPVTVIGPRHEQVTANLDNFRYQTNGTVKIQSAFKPVNVVIDPEDIFFDANRLNNDAKLHVTARYRVYGWGNYRPDAYTLEYAPVFGFTDASRAKLGLNIHGTYRGWMREFDTQVWASAGEHPIDARIHIPVKINFRGGTQTGAISASYLEGITQSRLEWTQRWSRTFWREPIHSLNMGLDYIDIAEPNVLLPVNTAYSQFSTKYVMQSGPSSFYLELSFSPEAWGNRSASFSQFETGYAWTKEWDNVTLKSRVTGFAGDGDIPAEGMPVTSGASRLEQFNNDASRYLALTSDFSEVAKFQHLSGGGNFRGWFNHPLAVPYMWSTNLQLERQVTRFPLPFDLKAGIFGDFGQYAYRTNSWTTLGDAGVCLLIRHQWKRTNWLTASLMPFKARIDFPVMRYESRVENVKWLSGEWSFSFEYAL
ncbi:MAG TPA: hypothetical protein DHU63_03600 [Candidatus Marinimicrobia bacterium]|nr:hypothetical protein [Candidatus Neomarinimicrobiota bacterium]